MVCKLFTGVALLAPLSVFAATTESGIFCAPEIDGSNISLAIALVGGIVAFTRRTMKKE